MTPVAEDDKQAPGAVPRVFEEFKAQLSSFDEQLAVLERMLTPIAEWSRAWADLEHRLLPGRPGQEPP